MTPAHRYPALANLLGGGFHQDFWDDVESPAEVVSDFTPDRVFCARLPLEVDSLLAEHDGPDRDDRLDAVLDSLHNNYDYTDDDITPSTWLTQLREQVLSETPATEAVDGLMGAQVVSVETAEALVLVTDGPSVRYSSGLILDAPGHAGVYARGEGREGVSSAVGERILVAYVGAAGQLRLATPTVEIVSDVEGPEPHWVLVH